MGFGILIFGYFAMFAFARSPYYFFADIVGSVVTVFALSKLGEYSRRFYGAMFSALGFLILCSVNAASLLFSLYPMGSGAAWTAVEILKLAAGCAMHVFLFLGIRTVAQRAEITSLASKALGRLAATSIYYGAAFLAVAFSPLLDDRTAAAAGVGIWLFWILCLVLNLFLLYGCFSMILPADADENEKPRSRIRFLNVLSDKFDELDDKKNEYRRQSMKMALEEAERIAAEKKKGKKKPTHKKKK